MTTMRGTCEILIDNQIVVGGSSFCTILDSINGTMTLTPELAGKLWIVEKIEGKHLYLKLHSYGKVYNGRIIITSPPPPMGKEPTTRVNFEVSEELKEVE